ncbi:hypothetical protein Rsub_04046 [Raphidocelis subcapitata]|uniref:Uncharacterized protein n=1 Tax=Raphidocelis subcapitata TaxID=307507 RepID=A0A2V0NYI7_9CHLO|nr:hypothetical protein Rsub_04046 [Raphidocelis subcapitata]|eukprot:GBF91742.1 hypothetical protein Rsub_04046 [Raphidocelis subcapitata]
MAADAGAARPSDVQRPGQRGGLAATLPVAALQVLGFPLHAAVAALLLPKRLAVALLYLTNIGSGDLLAAITGQPTSKTQLERHRQALSKAQQRLGAQQRLADDLRREVESLRADRRKLQRRNAELSARVEEFEEAQARAAAAGGDAGAFAAPRAGAASGPGWALHAAVAAAAAAVRWWLANETDPVQRKIMLVILWPAAWIYGAMLVGCLPAHSAPLRRAFLVFSCVLCGYVARAAIESTLGHAPAGAPRWAAHGGGAFGRAAAAAGAGR